MSYKIGKQGEEKAVRYLRKKYKSEFFVRNWIGSSGALGTIIATNPHIPQYIKTAMIGDIICPLGFPYSVEVKNYKNLKLTNKKPIEKFWEQAVRDAKIAQKLPMLIMFLKDGDWITFDGITMEEI